MRLDVNLASRPFVNHLPHLILLSTLLVAAIAVTAWNLTLFLATRSEARSVQAELDRIDAEERGLAERRTQLLARLERVDLAELAAETRAANDVLAERAVRWAVLLDRLEEILPYKTALDSIQTSFGPRGVEMQLDLRAQNREFSYQLLEALGDAACFSNAYPVRDEGSDGEIAVSIRANYDPACAESRTADSDSEGGPRG